MSTFKVRIEDYVGAVGDDTFLGDALTDTAAEVIRAMPISKIKGFTQESGDITNNSTNIANHRIVSVIRERGTDTEYVECRELPVKYFRKAQDSNSMFSASVESPIYIIKNSSIYVFPTPGASPNAFRVESVIFPTVVSSASDITDTPDSFPDSIEDVVVVGASAKACQYLMARVKDSMPSEPVLVLSDIAIPSTPSNPTISFANASLGDAVSAAQDAITVGPTDAAGINETAGPSDASGTDENNGPSNATGTGSTGSSDSSYTKPTVGGDAVSVTNVSSLAGDNTIDVLADQDDFDQWWATLGHFIEGEEDSELAASQVAKIKAYIEAFNAEVNSARSAMQATIEDARNLTQASIATAGDATQASVANAANDVSIRNASITSLTQASVANAANDVSIRNASIASQTQASVANASNDVNASISKMRESTGAAVAKMSQSTSVNVSNAAKVLEASIQDYTLEVNKFGADIQRYSSEVNTAINEYSVDIQKYTAQVDRYAKEYGWYQDQYVRLDTKFKESLQVLIAN